MLLMKQETYILTFNLTVGRDRMVVDLQLPVKSVPLTTDVVSSNLDLCEVYNIM